MDFSPAMSDFSNMDDEALDLYLAGCGTLSNLPTPPPPRRQPIMYNEPLTPPPEEDIEFKFDELRVYATHLTGLVQREKDEEEIKVVEGFLRRAMLPVEVYAFAGCILTTLSSTPLDLGTELTVLAALALAQGYLDDRGRSNNHWALLEAAGRFDAKEIQRAKMEILLDIDYGLFRISVDDVERMVEALRHDLPAPPLSTVLEKTAGVDGDARRQKVAIPTGFAGLAVWMNGVPTPEPSP